MYRSGASREGLCQIALYNGVFRFFFRKTQGHQLGELFARYLAHGGFVHEAGFGADGVYPGGGEYARVVQKYAVAFHMSERAVFAYHIRYERLVGIAPRHAAADDFCGAVFAYKFHLETGDCLFAVVGEQFFAHGELAVRVNGGGSEPVRIGNAAKLGALYKTARFSLRTPW